MAKTVHAYTTRTLYISTWTDRKQSNLCACLGLRVARHKLHWLPIKQRIAYKIVKVGPNFSCKSNWTVDNRHIFTMQLRSIAAPVQFSSALAPFLQRPHVNTVFSSHAFSAAALAVGNSLDINALSAETFSTFRRKLKTGLFRKSYDTWTLGRHRCAPDSHATDILGALKIFYQIRLD